MTLTPPTTTPTHHRALVATVFTLQFLVALDMSLVNIALPAMRADLGFTASGLQWVVNAYLLTFAGFMLLGGRLGDLWGRRTVILTGLTVFALASMIGGFATNPTILVAARAIQGVAAALLAPASLALASSADPADRKTAMAFWGGAGAAGGAVGVVLSGLLTDWWSWRAVLFVNVPIVVIALLAALRGVDAGHRRSVGRLDVPGAVLVTAGVASLVFAVAAAGDHGWSSARALIGFAAAAVLLTGFAVVERTAGHPLMPPRLLMTRSIRGANIFGFMLAAGQLAAFYFASLYVQTVWDVDSDVAGLLFLPFCAGVVLGIVLSGKLSPKIGARNSIGVLGLLGAAGLGLFAVMPDEFDFLARNPGTVARCGDRYRRIDGPRRRGGHERRAARRGRCRLRRAQQFAATGRHDRARGARDDRGESERPGRRLPPRICRRGCLPSRRQRHRLGGPAAPRGRRHRAVIRMARSSAWQPQRSG